MPQDTQTLTFIGSISFNGGEPSYRHLAFTVADGAAEIVSATRHPAVQPIVMHFGEREADVIAYLVAALQQQEQDVPRILALAAAELPATAPSDASQATA